MDYDELVRKHGGTITPHQKFSKHIANQLETRSFEPSVLSCLVNTPKHAIRANYLNAQATGLQAFSGLFASLRAAIVTETQPFVAMKEAEHILVTTDKRIQEGEERQVATHASDMATLELTTQQTKEAQAIGTSLVQYQELNAAVEKHRKMKEIDGDAYAREALIDLNAALAEKIIEHKKILAIEKDLSQLLLERAELADSNISPEVKQALLEIKDRVIEGFRRNLDEQMARHLLQEAAPENVEGTDSEAEGESCSPEDS